MLFCSKFAVYSDLIILFIAFVGIVFRLLLCLWFICWCLLLLLRVDVCVFVWRIVVYVGVLFICGVVVLCCECGGVRFVAVCFGYCCCLRFCCLMWVYC